MPLSFQEMKEEKRKKEMSYRHLLPALQEQYAAVRNKTPLPPTPSYGGNLTPAQKARQGGGQQFLPASKGMKKAAASSQRKTISTPAYGSSLTAAQKARQGGSQLSLAKKSPKPLPIPRKGLLETAAEGIASANSGGQSVKYQRPGGYVPPQKTYLPTLVNQVSQGMAAGYHLGSPKPMPLPTRTPIVSQNTEGKSFAEIGAASRDNPFNKINTYQKYLPSIAGGMSGEEILLYSTATDEDRAVINSFYGQYPKEIADRKAQQYWNDRAMQAVDSLANEENNPFFKYAVSPALNIMATQAGVVYGAETVGKSIQNLINGENETVPEESRGSQMMDLAEKSREIFTKDMSAPQQFFADVGLSVANNLASRGLYGPGARFMLGAQAGTGGAYAAGQKGGTGTQQLLSMGAQGIAEYLGEGFSFRGLENIVQAGGRGGLKAIAKAVGAQMGIEFTEEAATEAMNILSDLLIMGNQSDIAQYYTSYRQANPDSTQSQAGLEVALETLRRIGQAGAAGAVSGGIMGVGANVVGRYQGSILNSKQNSDPESLPIAQENTSNSVKKTIIDDNPATHTAQQMKTINEFKAAVNEKILDFTQKIRGLKDKNVASKLNCALSEVGNREVQDIKKATGIDTSGYIHNLNGSAIYHIDDRHGLYGEHDRSMSVDEDIARIDYILKNYDVVERLFDANGKPVFTASYVNSDNSPSQVIAYKKRLNGTFYVVEAVPDSKKKNLQVITAYIENYKKNGSTASAEHTTISGLQPTSEPPHASASNSSIADASLNGNSSGDTGDIKKMGAPQVLNMSTNGVPQPTSEPPLASTPTNSIPNSPQKGNPQPLPIPPGTPPPGDQLTGVQPPATMEGNNLSGGGTVNGDFGGIFEGSGRRSPAGEDGVLSLLRHGLEDTGGGGIPGTEGVSGANAQNSGISGEGETLRSEQGSVYEFTGNDGTPQRIRAGTEEIKPEQYTESQLKGKQRADERQVPLHILREGAVLECDGEIKIIGPGEAVYHTESGRMFVDEGAGAVQILHELLHDAVQKDPAGWSRTQRRVGVDIQQDSPAFLAFEEQCKRKYKRDVSFEEVVEELTATLYGEVIDNPTRAARKLAPFFDNRASYEDAVKRTLAFMGEDGGGSPPTGYGPNTVGAAQAAPSQTADQLTGVQPPATMEVNNTREGAQSNGEQQTRETTLRNDARGERSSKETRGGSKANLQGEVGAQIWGETTGSDTGGAGGIREAAGVRGAGSGQTPGIAEAGHHNPGGGRDRRLDSEPVPALREKRWKETDQAFIQRTRQEGRVIKTVEGKRGTTTYSYKEITPEQYTPHEREMARAFAQWGVTSVIVTDGPFEANRNGESYLQRGDATTVGDGAVFVQRNGEHTLIEMAELAGHESLHVGQKLYPELVQAYRDSIFNGNYDISSPDFKDFADRIETAYFANQMYIDEETGKLRPYNILKDFALFEREATAYISGFLNSDPKYAYELCNSWVYDWDYVVEEWVKAKAAMGTRMDNTGSGSSSTGYGPNTVGAAQAAPNSVSSIQPNAPSIRNQIGNIENAGYKIPKIATPAQLFIDEAGNPLPFSKYPAAIQRYLNKTFRGKVLQIGNDHKVYINGTGIKEFSYPANRRMDSDLKTAKYVAGASLDKTLEPAMYLLNTPDDGRHPAATGGWDNFYVMFQTEDGIYSGIVKTMNTEKGRLFYDITEIKKEDMPPATYDVSGKNPPPATQSISSNESISEMPGNIKPEGALGYGPNTVGAAQAAPVQTADQLTEQHGAIPPGEQPRAREARIPQETPSGKTMRFARTAAESGAVSSQMAGDIVQEVVGGTFAYTPMSNKFAVAQANTQLQNLGYEGAYSQWRALYDGGKRIGKEDIALAERLVQEAAKAGDSQRVMTLIADIAAVGNDAGQAVQALSMLKRLTPEGQILAVQRQLNRMNSQKNKNRARSAKDITQVNSLKDQLAQTKAQGNLQVAEALEQQLAKLNGEYYLPQECVEDILSQSTPEGLEQAWQRSWEKIAEQIPANWWDKWNAWRYTAMLSNSRTHVRNVLSNTAFGITTQVKNMIGTGLEAGAAKLLPGMERSKSILNPLAAGDRRLLEFARQDYDQLGKTLTAGQKNTPEAILERHRRIFNTSWLETVRKGNSAALELEDAFFKRATYVTSLAQYLKANGITPEMLAAEKAHYRPTRKELTAKPDGVVTQIAPVEGVLLHSKMEPEAFTRAYNATKQFVKQQAWYGQELVNGDQAFARRYGELKGRITIDTLKKGRSYTGSFGVEQLAIMPHLKEIFERGTVISVKGDEKNTGKLTRVFTLLSPVEFADGRTGVVKLNVKEYIDPRTQNKIHENKILDILDAQVVETGNKKGTHASTLFKPFQQGTAQADAAMGSTYIVPQNQGMGNKKGTPAYTAGHYTKGVSGHSAAMGSTTTIPHGISGVNTMPVADMLTFLRDTDSRYQPLPTPFDSVDAALDRARKYATDEALKATFQDASAAANALNRLKRTNKVTEVLGGGMFPFTKTPINIAKRGVEYSPIGLLKTTYDGFAKVRAGKMEATELLDELAAGLTGTGVMALGVWLASQGWLTGGGSDDKKEGVLENLKGNQQYALTIGDKSYSLEWMAPVAIPLFAGVELAHSLEDGTGSVTALLDNLTKIEEPLFNMSALSSFNRSIKSAAYGNNPLTDMMVDAATSYISQGLPAPVGALARTLDGTRRNTYYVDKNSPMPEAAQLFLNKAKAKIPGLSQTLPAYVDQWGRESEAKSLPIRAAENFISPGYFSTIRDDAPTHEIDRLYDMVGDGAVVPKTAPKSLNFDGTRYDLTGQENARWQKTMGQTAYQMVNALLDNPFYMAMNDSEKSAIVEQAYRYAQEQAKAEFLESRDISYEDSSGQKLLDNLEKAREKGIDQATYFALKQGLSNIEGRKDIITQKTIPGSVKEAKMKYLTSHGYDYFQALKIYELLV